MSDVRKRQTLEYQRGYADAKKIYKRKKGKWIPERLQCTNGGSYQVYRCDQCQEAFNWRMDFCGGCGADMRGECIYKRDLDGKTICYIDGYELSEGYCEICDRKVVDGK